METALVLARFVQFAAGMVLGGTPLFYLYGPPPPRGPWPRRLISAAALLGALAVVGWLMAQAALFGDHPADALAPLKVWSVATDTGVGRAGLVRIALFGAAFFAARLIGSDRSTWLTPASLGGVVAASLAWLGHGRSGDGVLGSLHLIADIAHLIAAAAWIGALPPLAVLMIGAARSGLEAERRDALTGLESFSGGGPAVVAVLVATGVVNGWILVGAQHLGDLTASVYGVALLIKLSLFALMLLLAAANRLTLTPALARSLDGPDSSTYLAALRTSLVCETLLGFAVLACVAVLGVQAPPAVG